jgi:multidrug efflux pump subunit AcrA (membrane-fusion protein)
LIDDVRLKSGMTANVEITTEIKQGAILIPQESIIRKNGFSFVQVKVGKEIIEKQVTVGSVSSTGEIEILAGLVSGEMVVRAPVGLNK